MAQPANTNNMHTTALTAAALDDLLSSLGATDDKSAGAPIDISMCPDCGVDMGVVDGKYECGLCHRVCNYSAPVDRSQVTPASFKRVTGGRRGYYYGVAGDYSKKQRSDLLNHLNARNEAYTGNKFHHNILERVADRYNELQKSTGVGLVRRGNVKDELLAALIHDECISAGMCRRPRDIAQMMMLQTDGFSRGEKSLRVLERNGKIRLASLPDYIRCYTDRYIESLGWTPQQAANYRGFVIDIVRTSEEACLGMNSLISSKVVGAIWLVIERAKLPITVKELEMATDNTKKHTFNIFCNDVRDNMHLFEDIYEKYELTRRRARTGYY